MVERPILTVEGLTCRFGEITGCEDVSFEVYPGEVVGIVGESGSGKTTVLRALYTDLVPDAGTAHLSSFRGGQTSIWEADMRERRELRNRQLGMVYQNPREGLDLMITAGGNIVERLLATGWNHVGEMRARAGGYLERTEVPLARMDHLPAYFSGGMQQRVQLAKALANGPEIVLLDEPTTGLDVSVQAGVLDLIRDIQRTSTLSLVVVSHDLGVVRLLADRTLVMKDGRVVETGLTDQILEDPQHPYTQLLVSSAA
ncbi:MAG: ATP-binding cassette domain-containing protein [Chloroflexota bacterium]